MKKKLCTVCNVKKSVRNIHKNVCKPCRNKGYKDGDKLPCFVCGDTEQPKKYKLDRMFCLSCFKTAKWLPTHKELSAWIDRQKK